MAISKTDFINYSRCPRYAFLDKVKKDKLDADISYEEYQEKEKMNKLEAILERMYSDFGTEEEEDLIDVPDKQLEAMMDFYKQVELEAGRVVEKYFGGETMYAKSNFDQALFDFNRNGIRYMCYVDVYNENEDGINIIEVKASTTNNYKNLGYTNKEQGLVSVFEKNGPFYKLKGELYNLEETDIDIKKYNTNVQKLYNRYDKGKYVYDLAVQRFMIEGDYKECGNEKMIPKVHYYLAVLNADYIFDGTYKDGKPVYDINKDGEEIINFIDLTKVTEELQPSIIDEATKIENILFDLKDRKCDLGVYCQYKKSACCKFFKQICGKDIPEKNSSLNYYRNGFGFKTPSGETVKGVELINRGYLKMLDVPADWIKSKNHLIQRECLEFDKVYVNKEKLKAGLSQIKYPIYHLDFETFPCPLPRFKGEWPYIQSPFEFSLHIEREPGVCDKEKDNFVFLAKTHNDEREELVKALIEHIDGTKGTLFAQNVSFEMGRIKELAQIFPKYKKELMQIHDRGFDLLWLVSSNNSLYQELGYSPEEAGVVNYYHKNLSGSFSIKKTLPVFSDLSYKDLTVKNGTEAIVEYANYDKMSKEEYNIKYQALIDYCQQDTWAMVVILDELRKLVK